MSYASDSFDEFESILNEASDTATKKFANVDYLPSVVSVIDAQKFLDAGLQNVGEALGMLPGVQMQLGFLGQNITTIRGFKNPNSFISDKIKVLIDGVAINNEAAGTSGFYMDFPLDLVERIEVLRGPGSTEYGAGAIYGSINIITKTGNQSKQKSFFWGVGSYQEKITGGNINTSLGEYKISADAYYAQNKKSISGSDEAKEDLSIGMKIIKGDFTLLSRYKSSHYGNFYARSDGMYPNNDRGHKDDYFLSSLSYGSSFGGYKLDTELQYSYRESDITAYASNDASLFENIFAAFGREGMSDAFYVRDHQVEQNIEAKATLTLPKISINDIVIGLGARYAYITTNEFYSSLENAIDGDTTLGENSNFPFNNQSEPAFWMDPTSSSIFSKTDRTISYINIQDLITLNQKIDIVLGARVDNYSDLGINYSARAGVVYRADDTLILKLLYGSAFRAPTFTERYSKGHIFYRAGDDNLNEESSSTYEAVVIYKPNLYNKLSLNLFYSTLSDVIDLEEYNETYVGYQNMKERSSRGVELEYYFSTNTEHNLYCNATYIDAQYRTPSDPDSPQEIEQSMPDISKFMFKALYTYKLTKMLSFGTLWQYYSKSTQTKLQWVVQSDRETAVRAQSIFDETISYRFSRESQLRFTAKNLFDEEIRVPSYYYREAGGVLREGRTYYLTYKYTF